MMIALRGESAQTLQQIRPRYVRNVMTSPVITIAPHTLCVHAELLATATRIHHLPVTQGGRVLGMMCLCDLWSAGSDAVAAEVMTTTPTTIPSHAPLMAAVDAIRDLRLGCLPVVDGEDLVGIITRGDLGRAGLLEREPATRVCAACGALHHVHRLLCGNTVAFCMECIDRGRAADIDDPFEELGGGD